MSSDPHGDQLLEFQEQILRLNERIRRTRFWRRFFHGSLWIAAAALLVLFISSYFPTSRAWGPLDALMFAVLLASLAYACIYAYVIRDNRKNGSWLPVGELELQLAIVRERKAALAVQLRQGSDFRRASYRDRTVDDLQSLRGESGRWRRTHNAFQGIIIIGSLLTTTLAGIATQAVSLRWFAVLSSFAVGISAGFTGYFKFRERSFYLQQTADAIEQEWNSVELGIGKYNIDDEDKALRMFVEESERLKNEQRKREQNLDQPPDTTDKQ